MGLRRIERTGKPVGAGPEVGIGNFLNVFARFPIPRHSPGAIHGARARHYMPPGPCRDRHYTAPGACEDSELRHRDFASDQTRCLRPIAARFPEPVASTPAPLCGKRPSNSSSIPSRSRREQAPDPRDSEPRLRESSPRSSPDWPARRPIITGDAEGGVWVVRGSDPGGGRPRGSGSWPGAATGAGSALMKTRLPLESI